MLQINGINSKARKSILGRMRSIVSKNNFRDQLVEFIHDFKGATKIDLAIDEIDMENIHFCRNSIVHYGAKNVNMINLIKDYDIGILIEKMQFLLRYIFLKSIQFEDIIIVEKFVNHPEMSTLIKTFRDRKRRFMQCRTFGCSRPLIDRHGC